MSPRLPAITNNEGSTTAREKERPPSQQSLSPGRKAAFLTEAPHKVEEIHTPATELSNEMTNQPAPQFETDPAKREIVDMILVWEDKMQQMIYADKQGYKVYKETDDSSE